MKIKQMIGIFLVSLPFACAYIGLGLTSGWWITTLLFFIAIIATIIILLGVRLMVDS